jgi:hypothetical protein
MMELEKDTDPKQPTTGKKKYILVIPQPDLPGYKRKVYFSIDKSEEKVLRDIREYVRKNNFHGCDLFLGWEVKL